MAPAVDNATGKQRDDSFVFWMKEGKGSFRLVENSGAVSLKKANSSALLNEKGNAKEPSPHSCGVPSHQGKKRRAFWKVASAASSVEMPFTWAMVSATR